MALIMQCVSLFLQFLWATGLLLASKLALFVQHLHLKQISCGNLTDYFSHFRFPWSWSPFSTCSSGPSAPCMVRPLWLVCWFRLRSFELLELLSGQSLASISSASTSETDILWIFENRLLSTLLQLSCSLNTFHYLLFRSISTTYNPPLGIVCCFDQGLSYFSSELVSDTDFLIAFRRLPLFLITTCSLGQSVCVLPLIGSVCQPTSCRSVQILQSLHLKQIFFYISSLSLVCGWVPHNCLSKTVQQYMLLSYFGIGPFPLLMFLCRVSFHLKQISFTFHLLYICSTWLQKPAHDSVWSFSPNISAVAQLPILPRVR